MGDDFNCEQLSKKPIFHVSRVLRTTIPIEKRVIRPPLAAKASMNVPTPQEWLETATRWFLNFEGLAESETLQALTRTYLQEDAKTAGLWKQPDFLQGAAEMLQLGFKTMWLRLCERTRKTKLKRERWVKRLRKKRAKPKTNPTD